MCLMLTAGTASALVPVPPVQARVTDITGTLSARQKVSLEQTLKSFQERKGTQIAVLILPTTQPETIEQYSLRVVEDWKLGREGVDDGALLIVAKDDRTMRIEVGYGLEGPLNDATAKRIIAEVITPYFRNSNFFGGIQAGVQAMMKVIEGEPLPAPAPPIREGNRGGSVVVLSIVFFAFILGQMFRGIIGRFPAALSVSVFSTVIVWLLIGSFLGAVLSGLMIFVILLFGGVRAGRGFGGGGYYSVGGLGAGGWTTNTGSGGGVGGGGGSFGGGGASGRW